MRIVILLFDRVTALDAVGPYEVLSRIPDAEVAFAATCGGAYRSDRGLALGAEVSLEEVGAPDVLVIPGGPGIGALLDDEQVLGWLADVRPRTTWTTSVCTGSLLLAAAGILEGVEATTHFAAMEELRRLGALPVRRRVVRSGKVLTGAGVSAGIDMALQLAALVADIDTAVAIQLLLEYQPEPPFDIGQLMTADPNTQQRALGPLTTATKATT